MAWARRVRGGGTRSLRVALLVAVSATGCTEPNPFYNRADEPMGGASSSGGGGGRDGAGGLGGSGLVDASGTGGITTTGGSQGSGGAGATGGTTVTGGTGGVAGGPATGGSGGASATGGIGGSSGGSGGVGGSAAGAGGSTAGVGGTTAGAGGSTAGAGGTIAGAGGSTAGSGGGSVDSGPGLDTGGMSVGSPPASCGVGHAAVAGISGARAIAVDPSGTVYFTRESGNQVWIGRQRLNMPIEASWYGLENGAQPRGLRMDSRRGLLYIAISNQNQYRVVTTTNDRPIANAKAGFLAASGLAIASDGSVFISSGDGYVYWSHIDFGMAPAEKTTTAPIFPTGQRPLGLAFGPTGHLYVGSNAGGIKRFRVEAQKLVVPGEDYSPFVGTANDLAFDVQGRLYIADSSAPTARALAIVAPDGRSVATSGAPGLLSGLAFGRGGLDCRDLYIADAAGVVRTFTTVAPALDLP